METLHLTTLIDAPVERSFLLSLNIDLQRQAAEASGDKVVAGTTSGLIRTGQSVTWASRRFGLDLHRSSFVVAWRPYAYFSEIMTEGDFALFEHHHYFAPMNDGTRMRDEIRWSPPRGILGRLLRHKLKTYLKTAFEARNTLLKDVAESDRWRRYLDSQPTFHLPARQTAPRQPQQPTNPRALVTAMFP